MCYSRQTNADDCNAAIASMGDTSIVMDSMLKDDDNDDDIAHTDTAIDDSHIVHNNQVSCYVCFVSHHIAQNVTAPMLALAEHV
jgi:hypothetical protein